MSDDLLVASSGSVLAPPPDRCHFFVKRKKRNCRMLVKPGKKFCGEHALEKDNPDFANPNLSVKRIPCPYDPKHSCEEARLESHMLKCRAKPVPLPDYCEKGVNGSFGEDPSEKATTIGSVTDEKLMSVIDTIDRVFASLEKKFTVSILSHPVVEDHMKDPSFGPSVLKHLKQNSSILGLLESNDLLQNPSSIVEFGSGRGQLTYWITKSVPQDNLQAYDFLLVDRASHRHKFDNRLKDQENITIQRIRADIQDLVLQKMSKAQPGTDSKPILGVSKHLCGAATDLALNCIANAKDHVKISGILIALCCHHRCSWGCYVGKEFLKSEEVGLQENDFGLLKGLTSWATCGTGKPREKRDKEPEANGESKEIDVKDALTTEEKKKENPHDLRYEKLNLPRERREEIGKKTKRILDYGRAEFIRQKLGLEVKLIYYCTQETSLENVLLLAK